MGAMKEGLIEKTIISLTDKLDKLKSVQYK